MIASSLTLNVDSYFDKVFYINLPEDNLRNEQMIRQLKQYGISNYERVEAVRFTEIPGFELYRNFNKHDRKYVLGQLSCRAMHVKLMKLAKDRSYDKILILEDDALLLQDPNALLRDNNQVLNEWDMLYYGGQIEPHFRNQIVCTHAYAVKSSLFDNIIYMAEASGMEIDNFYAKILQHMSYNYNRSGKYNIRIIQPFNQVIQDNKFASQIQS
ncbi:MAG: glycosyltransferase family 25 protein [Bacteroidetes bacterium]|nr:glycosyltransferase family 25 protein [Bacteroidota bacterium]